MEEVWQQLTRARTELRDPGLYRWPPHANLMYPFIDSKHFQKDDVLEKLQRVASQSQPFCISLDKFGTFGGNHRGVLWLYPRSYYDKNQTEHTVVVAQQHDDNHSMDNNDNEDVGPETMEKNTTKEPLVALQALLEEQFPSQQGAASMAIRPFAPHMTLSHYPSQQEALEALAQVESWWTPQSFVVNEIYVLVRDGDNGQFQRAITIPLGNYNSSNSDNNTLMVHRPTLSFPDMPKVEEDWVREERMKLKKRRNGRGGGGGGRSRRRQTNDMREISGGRSRRPSTDTPEEIAAKRAARKAKRERLLQQDNQKSPIPLTIHDKIKRMKNR
jgi:2'-5' RNA ligase